MPKLNLHFWLPKQISITFSEKKNEENPFPASGLWRKQGHPINTQLLLLNKEKPAAFDLEQSWEMNQFFRNAVRIPISKMFFRILIQSSAEAYFSDLKLWFLQKKRKIKKKLL